MEDYLKNELDKKNILTFMGIQRTLKGFPDRVVFGEIVYYIELKLGKENKSYYEQTPMQNKWEKQIKQTPNKYLLLSNRDDIDRWVEIIYENCLLNGIQNFFAHNKKIE